jgi:hypothetical protein
MLNYYQEKYQTSEIWHIVRSLVYFDDADKESKDPDSLKDQKRASIKKQFETTVKKFIATQHSS